MKAPPTTEALLFDVGNVLLRIDPARCHQYWAQFSPLSATEMAQLPLENEAFEQHERGELSDAAFFETLRQQLSLDASDAQIEAGWNAMVVEEIFQTTAMIRNCHQRIRCSIFSNTNPAHQRLWAQDYGHFLGYFEQVFVSSEMGQRKPAQASFGWVCDQLSLPPAQVLFFDDREENIAGAHAAGLQAVLVKSSQDVAAALKPLGLV